MVAQTELIWVIDALLRQIRLAREILAHQRHARPRKLTRPASDS
jgi:hypothetical protein